MIRYVGTDHCAFVDDKDYREWSESLFKTTGFLAGRKVSRGDHSKITLDNKHLEWAVGMVWPDQSYVSLRTYRGPKRNYWWSGFQHSRLEVITGVYIFFKTSFVLDFFVFSRIC
jgi:hypothetical protein